MSTSLLSLRTKNRLFFLMEQWHFGKRHEELVDAGFDDYGFDDPIDEDKWESARAQNLAYWEAFKSEVSFDTPEALIKLCSVLNTAIAEIDDWPNKGEFLELLEGDGFQIENNKVRYVRHLSAQSALRTVACNFDLISMQTQLNRIERAVDTDPSLAIGSAKELIETCCKTILSERHIAIEAKWDVPQLVKTTVKELKLTADDIPEPTQDSTNAKKAAEAMKMMLSNLAAIAGNMATLRNAVGTGHGPDGRVRGPKPRHARLAVNATGALVMFLFDTHVAMTEIEEVTQSKVRH